MDRDLVITLVLLSVLLGGPIGYEKIFQENYNNYERSYDIGYQEGVAYQFKTDLSNIVLGLLYISGSGYYIVNQNYGNFKLNATNQTEALKYLQKEISPCL
jgi:hypothetical protein